MNIEEVLGELGYKLNNRGYYYTTNAMYREGQDPTSLTIYPDKNLVIDWVSGERMSLERLVQMTLKLSTPIQAKEWLKTKNVNIIKVEEEPKLEEPQILPIKWLNYLTPDHSYWIKRGISEEVIKEFKGGIATEQIPRMKGRYCFPIIQDGKLVGLQGRSLNGKMPKYKIVGFKSGFLYDVERNLPYINQKREIILVESIGNALSLSTAGINNWMVLFGVSLSNQQLSKIISINPNRIIISTDNDNGAGNEGAQKIYARLIKFFDRKQIEVRLPKLKDINEAIVKTGVDSIKEMYGLV